MVINFNLLPKPYCAMYVFFPAELFAGDPVLVPFQLGVAGPIESHCFWAVSERRAVIRQRSP